MARIDIFMTQLIKIFAQQSCATQYRKKQVKESQGTMVIYKL